LDDGATRRKPGFGVHAETKLQKNADYPFQQFFGREHRQEEWR
jgi:hypothetical protein